ncbi:MAG: choice-of-anchor G family protein [Jatrophihabitans sp.]
MTANSSRGRGRGTMPGRTLAAIVTVGLASTAIVTAGGGTAGAAAAPSSGSTPVAQAGGNFLDATLGGGTLDPVAKLKFAYARAPGATSVQNPLDVTALNAINLPLTGALQLPGGGAFNFGAANQVAQAKLDESSFGASGAVSNTGGVSLNDNKNQFPANATIDLSSDALGKLLGGGVPSLPIPGLPGLPTGGGGTSTSLPSLGGVKAEIGAVSGLAQNKVGGAQVTPKYQIANVKLTIGSPALGGLLGQLAQGGTALKGLLGPVISQLGILLPSQCDLTSAITSGTLPMALSLDGGAVVLDAKSGGITVDVGLLLKQLKLDLNNMPANTDLLGYVLGNLGTILSKGLENVINGITDPLAAQGQACIKALAGPLAGPLSGLLTTLTNGQTMLETTINGIADQLSSAGAPGLQALAKGLAMLLDIGINVEHGPGKQADNTKYPFTTGLLPTVKQGTPVIANQSLVRAIEIRVAGAGSGGLPGLPGLGAGGLPGVPSIPGVGGFAAPHALAAANSGALTVALGNAVSGPSRPAAGPPSGTNPAPPVSSGPPANRVPTGVPAGAAGNHNGGSPALPLIVLLLGLTLAGGGYLSFRMRGKYQP